MERKGKKLGRGAIIVLIAVLAVMLVVVLSSTALAGGTQYKFDPSKFDLSKFDHRINWSDVGWSSIDFNKYDMKDFDWSKFDWGNFHWGHECTTTTEEVTTTVATDEEVTTTVATDEEVTTTAVSVVSSDTTEGNPTTTVARIVINTGGGGTAGPGAGTWALGFFALALAGGLGWTAVRPALKRK